jgi:hypothetical protein
MFDGVTSQHSEMFEEVELENITAQCETADKKTHQHQGQWQ